MYEKSSEKVWNNQKHSLNLQCKNKPESTEDMSNRNVTPNIPLKPGKIKRDYPWFTTDRFGNRVKPKPVFRTRLKFFSHPDFKGLVAFIHRENSGVYLGVRADFSKPKVPCFIDPELEAEVQEGVLYDCTFVFKNHSNTAVCIEATKKRFKAKVTTEYLKNIIYSVMIQVGNRKYWYDPKDGATGYNKFRLKHRDKVKAKLEALDCIENKEAVLADFDEAADKLDKLFHKDGYL